MNLYTTILLFGFLCHKSQGAVTTATIKLGEQGEEPVTGGAKLSAKIGAQVYIRCEYDGFNHPKQVLTLKYRSSADAEKQTVFLPGFTGEPWANSPDTYMGGFHWDSEPYFLNFNITGVQLSDAGEYFCEVDLNTNQPDLRVSPTSASLEVFVNSDSVVLEGAEDGKYATFADGKEIKVICTAYNGSKPHMNLIIGEETIPFESVEAREGQPGAYEGNVYYIFKPSQNKEQVTCEAIVPGYEMYPVNATAELIIHAPPQINCPESITGEENAEVKVECTISGHSLPEAKDISWRTPTGNIGANMELESDGLSSMTEAANGKVNKVKLTIKIKGSQSYGIYILTATNTGGPQTAKVELKKPEVLDPVEDGDDVNGASPISVLYNSLLLLLLVSYSLIL